MSIYKKEQRDLKKCYFNTFSSCTMRVLMRNLILGMREKLRLQVCVSSLDSPLTFA